MNKMIFGAAVMTLTSGVSFNAGAMLASNAILQFNSGVTGCSGSGSYPNCSSSSGYAVTTGSYFSMDYNADGIFTDYEHTAMTVLNGVYINASQPASGSHSGNPDGTESASIDAPFSFFANTGMHQTTSPVSILSDDGNGHVMLDFSGWSVTWNSIPDIYMGGSDFWGDTGIATLVCGTDCSVGDTFTLNYAAHVPPNHPSNFSDVYYGLHLEGTIGAVPVPAAFWLFDSGLLGLACAMKRHKAA